jgi:hypothetical protein
MDHTEGLWNYFCQVGVREVSQFQAGPDLDLYDISFGTDMGKRDFVRERRAEADGVGPGFVKMKDKSRRLHDQ